MDIEMKVTLKLTATLDELIDEWALDVDDKDNKAEVAAAVAELLKDDSTLSEMCENLGFDIMDPVTVLLSTKEDQKEKAKPEKTD